MAMILIVDDSDTLRSQLREALETAGHAVIEACDGAEGLKMAEVTPGIQMIITDYNMPQMDGLTMVDKIRALPKYKRTPILMLTTETTSDLKAEGKRLGIFAWIVKPLAADKLLPVLAKLLG